VIVQIEPVHPTPPATASVEDFASLPFFGLWADRTDLPASETWVRERRDAWQRRAIRPD
jgi:hypothetical protein